MNAESFAIVGLTLIGIALPVMGAWFYQVFALKRELSDVERRLNERLSAVENKCDAIVRSTQNYIEDNWRFMFRINETIKTQKKDND